MRIFPYFADRSQNGSHDFCPSGPHQSGKSKNLSPGEGELISRNNFSVESWCTSRIVSPILASSLTKILPKLPSDHPLDHLFFGNLGHIRRPHESPSRSTVTRSQSMNTSSRRCEINTMLTPCCFRLRETSNNFKVSCSVSDEVGSSMIMSFAFWESALATSTICFCAMDSCLTVVRDLTANRAVQQPLTFGVHRFLINPPQRQRWFTAEEDIFRDGQIRSEHEFLINRTNSNLLRFSGVSISTASPFQ